MKYITFHRSNTFISNPKLKFIKTQENVKQHPEAKILLFENYSHSSPKNNRIYSRK